MSFSVDIHPLTHSNPLQEVCYNWYQNSVRFLLTRVIKVMQQDLRDTVVTTESLQQAGTVVAADKIELSERVSSIFTSHYRGMYDAAVVAVKRNVRLPSDSQSHHDDEQ